VAGLDDEGRARERCQCEDHAEGLSLEDGLHSYYHRIPAPTAKAIDASSISAMVKRARIAFTIISLS
jgi:hypothetical protein